VPEGGTNELAVRVAKTILVSGDENSILFAQWCGTGGYR